MEGWQTLTFGPAIGGWMVYSPSGTTVSLTDKERLSPGRRVDCFAGDWSKALRKVIDLRSVVSLDL